MNRLLESILECMPRAARREAHHASESRFRALTERSRDVAAVLHPSGRLEYVNPACAVMGYEPQELIGRVVFDDVHADDVARVRAAFARAVEGDTAGIQEQFRLRHKNGSWRIMEAVVANCLELPEIRGIVVNGRDVTDAIRSHAELHATELALARSEAEYRGLIDRAPLAIYRTNRDGRLLAANPAFTRLLGYTGPGELMGLNVARDVYVNPEDRTRLLAMLDEQDDCIVEVPCRRKDGTLASARVHVHAVRDADGSLECIESIAEDVTEQRRQEERHRQAQRLEAIGQLAGGIAHDFNNMLTVILGYAELVRHDLGPCHGSSRDIAEVIRAADTAAALTSRILAFSRRQILQPRVIDLNEVIEGTQLLLQRSIGEHIALTISVEPRLARIMADPSQVEQILLNLAVNARDAMPDGGALTIETANVTLGDEFVHRHRGAAAGPHVMLGVSDTGTGMDANTQRHLFEPFFTTKPPGKGTGLGLATVYGIVKQSGGSIWVYSEVGRGSTFKIYLPAASTRAPLGRSEDTAALPSGTETILLVEDQAHVRAAATAMLRRQGYTVLEAGSGMEALAVAAAHGERIDLVIADIVLPEMDGRQVAHALHSSGRSFRTLYTSGYTDEVIVRHGVLEPGLAFLQKPYTRGTLLRKVRETLDADLSSPRQSAP